MSAPESRIQRTWSAEEFNDLVNEQARPAREDDQCVLAIGSDGVWEVASDDEIAAWADKHRRRQQRQ